MRKIFIIASGMFLIGCGGSSDKDCNCTQQRWERKATYTNADGTTNPPKEPVLISSTEWQKKGDSESAGTDDCSRNGTVKNKGESNLTPNSNNTYTVTQYEYRVTCQ